MKNHLIFLFILSVLAYCGCQSEEAAPEENPEQAQYSRWDGRTQTKPADFSDSSHVFTICRASDMAWLSFATHPDSSYNGFEGYAIRLGNNLDLGGIFDGEKWKSSGKNWTPIGNSSLMPFKGNFDGAGFKIKNLYVEQSEGRELGLFGHVTGNISNVVIESGGVHALHSGTTKYLGSICGYTTGSVNGCSSNAQVCSSESVSYVGGICGRAESVTNCQNFGTIYSDEFLNSDTCLRVFMGGIAGELTDASDCINRGLISSIARDTAWMGGIAALSKGDVSDCSNLGKLSHEVNALIGVSFLGGITAKNMGEISRCTNSGKLYNVGPETHAGGICCIGRVIKICKNEGEIDLSPRKKLVYPGGIVSECDTIVRCENVGAIKIFVENKSLDVRLGGVCSSANWITDCVNRGEINLKHDISTNGFYHVGGIAGKGSTLIARCVNTGSISAALRQGYVGGILGYGGNTLIACLNTGSLSGNMVGGILGGSIMLSSKMFACTSKGEISCTSIKGPFCSNGGRAVSCVSSIACYPSSSSGLVYSYYSYPIPFNTTPATGGMFSASVWPDSSMPGWGDIAPADWDSATYGEWENPWSSLGSWNNGTPIYPVLKIEAQYSPPILPESYKRSGLLGWKE